MDKEPAWADPKQMEWFALKLEPGSEAEEWFDNLQAAEKDSMVTLKAIFDTAYPPDPKATKTIQDKWDRLCKYILEEDHMLDVDENGVYEYVRWGARMLTLSKGISDVNGLQASQIRDQLPKPMRRLIGEVVTFQELATKVQAVKKRVLEEAVEDRAEVATLRRELASSRTNQRAAADTSTKALTAAMSNLTFGKTNSQQSQLQSVISALANGMAPRAQQAIGMAQKTPQAAQAPRGQNAAAGQQGGFQFLRHSDADIELRARAPEVRLADYQRTKLRRTTTMEDFRAQVTEYERTHGNILATERRGYPLTPGTHDSGSGECVDCGYGRHRGEACTSPKLSYKERDYRRMASTIAWEIRKAGGVVAAPAAAAPNVNQATANLFMLLTQAASALQAQLGDDPGEGAHIEEVDSGNGDGVSE